jgi:hypothetical protein
VNPRGKQEVNSNVLVEVGRPNGSCVAKNVNQIDVRRFLKNDFLGREDKV